MCCAQRGHGVLRTSRTTVSEFAQAGPALHVVVKLWLIVYNNCDALCAFLLCSLDTLCLDDIRGDHGPRRG